MADGFTFELVSPEKLLLSGDAEIVSVPGVEGDMGILPNHAPVMTSLRPGFVTAKMVDGEEQSFFVRGGFADVTPTALTVLAEFAIAKTDMTQELIDEQKASVQSSIDDAGDDAAKLSSLQTLMHQLDEIADTLSA
ncbi:MAG: F0F1 ATP synthase subunit epsilon [Hyphomicrobiales bacterium]|nr:MAG: F0F1 ATP synthase subunit epsilon [Hyphomicrobiales bacterium]